MEEVSDPRDRELWYETNPSMGTILTAVSYTHLDVYKRQVFQLRVYRGMEWKHIAKAIGEQNEGYPRKCIYEKYLQKK